MTEKIPQARFSAGRSGRAHRSVQTIGVLIVDDHTVLRDGIAAILQQEKDFSVVGQAANATEAVALWQAHRPDVTLMDLQLPGDGDGVDAIYRIRAADANARIIILTTYDGDEDVYRGMCAGARAYLLKDVRREDLCQCIRDVHSGRTCVTPAIASKLAQRMAGEQLTPRELEVLQLLSRGLPNKIIGVELEITEVTVKSHVQAVFRKLNVLSRTEAIAVATRRGLLRQ